MGSQETSRKLQQLLKDYAELDDTAPPRFIICEVRDIADIKQVPRGINVPLFIYVNTGDKNIISQLRNLTISGVFTPQTDAEMLKRKLGGVLQNFSPAGSNAQDFEVLKVKILAKAENVPALPVFAQKLVSLTSSGASTIKEITEQIKMDQGISSKLMRLVNSSFYVLRQQVTSIDRAAVLLGFQTLKNIALAVTTASYYNKQFKMYGTTGDELWVHAYTVALIAEELAKKAQMDPDEMFLSGLFHDIGKTVMVDFLVQPVSDIAGEKRQLGIDHAEVAGMIVKRWQLPDTMHDAVRHHHTADLSINSKIIFVANRFAHAAEQNDEAALESEIEDALKLLPFIDKTQTIKRLTAIAQAAKQVTS